MSPVAAPAPRAGRGSLRALLGSGTAHFMGISGAGMSALAEAMARQGVRVTGCDWAPGLATGPVERLGVTIHAAHDPAHVADASVVIVTAAVPQDHPELAEARRRGIPVLKRAEALAEWVSEGTVVAVAGTHGKTTTTAMITECLARAGMDPTGFVGGWVGAWEGHLRTGRDDLFVVEADEYDRSFHHLRPHVAVVTNVEADHLDVYGDLAGVREGFREFLEGVPGDGTVVVCADDPGASSVLARVGRSARTFGFSAGSELRGIDLQVEGGGSAFRVIEDGFDRGRLELEVRGAHNARNALAASAAARVLGVEWSAIRSALREFRGVVRRFQRLGEGRDVLVIDDYAHHPTEIAAALATARAVHPDRRLVAVFQPHLFSRTRDFGRDFGKVLAKADAVWITEIYPAREAPIPGIDGAYLVDLVERAMVGELSRATEVRLHRDLGTLSDALARELRPGDLCLTLGAGSIERIGPELVTRLEGDA